MVVAGYVGRQVVSGATLYRGDRVVGLSNFFADINDLDASWAGCLEFARSLVPALPLVGYESGAHLAAALGHGFDAVGRLQVWIAEN